MLQYLIKWWGYPKSDNTWEPADQVYALDLLWEYHKCWPLESIKGKQKPPAKTTICTITSSKLPTIASQWPFLTWWTIGMLLLTNILTIYVHFSHTSAGVIITSITLPYLPFNPLQPHPIACVSFWIITRLLTLIC